VKFVSPLVSPKLASETECPSSPSLELEPCPSDYPITILEKENFCAMDNPLAPTLETEKKDSAVEHKSFSFETPHVSCSLLESLEFISLKTSCFYEDHNHLLILVIKLFKRMVVDAFVYHKFCKFYRSTSY
jgi:hypothetical protein